MSLPQSRQSLCTTWTSGFRLVAWYRRYADLYAGGVAYMYVGVQVVVCHLVPPALVRVCG